METLFEVESSSVWLFTRELEVLYDVIPQILIGEMITQIYQEPGKSFIDQPLVEIE